MNKELEIQDDPAESSRRISRRDTLRAAGFAASSFSFGAAGIEVAAAEKPDRFIANTHFVEIGLEHEVPDQSTEFPQSQIVSFDNFLMYVLNSEADQLVLGRFVSEENRRLFEKHPAVMKNETFRPLTPSPQRIGAEDKLTTLVGSDMNSARVLSVVEDYTAPEAEVLRKEKNDEVHLSSEGSTVEVGVDSFESLKLTSREVKVRLPTDSFREFEGRNGEMTKRRKYIIETMSVAPIFRVWNYGQLEVYDGTDGSE